MRRALFVISIIFFIVCMRMLITTGFGNNTILLFLLTSAFFVYGFFYERLKKIRPLNIAIISGAALWVGFSLFLFFYGINDTADFDEDIVIVLGCGIEDDGTVSNMLRHRLDAAVKYHEKNPAAVIIVSGGQGPDEIMPEAVAMKNYLTGRGVPAEKIIRDDKSLSTYENIFYSKQIIENNFTGPLKIALITSDFHIYRGVWFARAAGLDVTHYHGPSAWYGAPVNYARECAAVLKMWVIRK